MTYDKPATEWEIEEMSRKAMPAPYRPELDELIERARHHTMTPQERFEQKVSFVYGLLPKESTVTKEEVRARLLATDDVQFSFAADRAHNNHPELRLFTDAMALKLDKNRHKLEKPRLPVPALFKLLKAELIELDVAINHQTPDEAMEECVDMANFIMLIWKRLKEHLPPPDVGRPD